MKISAMDSVVGRFVVATNTPDGGRSTFSERFGTFAFSARAVSSHDTLSEAVAAADCYGCHAKIIDRRTGRLVGKKRLSEIIGMAIPV